MIDSKRSPHNPISIDEARDHFLSKEDFKKVLADFVTQIEAAFKEVHDLSSHLVNTQASLHNDLSSHVRGIRIYPDTLQKSLTKHALEMECALGGVRVEAQENLNLIKEGLSSYSNKTSTLIKDQDIKFNNIHSLINEMRDDFTNLLALTSVSQEKKIQEINKTIYASRELISSEAMATMAGMANHVEYLDTMMSSRVNGITHKLALQLDGIKKALKIILAIGIGHICMEALIGYFKLRQHI